MSRAWRAHRDPLVGMAVVALTVLSPLAVAQTSIPGAQLAAQRQCLGCHQVDSRRVGPPFRAVAQRFHGAPQAAQLLARAMRQGSSGQWGAIPMPAQTRLSDEDALRLAQWILSLSGPSGAATP